MASETTFDYFKVVFSGKVRKRAYLKRNLMKYFNERTHHIHQTGLFGISQPIGSFLSTPLVFRPAVLKMRCPDCWMSYNVKVVLAHYSAFGQDRRVL